MNEAMRQYMKVGLIHFMAYPSVSGGQGPIEETLKKIAVDDYFEVVEITWMKDPQTRKKARKIIETAHMTAVYGAQSLLLTTGYNINDIDENGREQALELLKSGIDEACEMGAKAFAFLSGKYSEDKKEAAYQALVKSTRQLCEYAKTKGNMKIVLEVFDYDIDKKSLIGPAALAARFAAEVTAVCDNFGLMVDLSHLPLLRETPEQSLLPVKDYIIHAHMGNCVVRDPALPAYGDAHPRFGFPNSENGVEELADYLRVLMSIGFISKEKRPIVSFEIKPHTDEDPDLVVANAKRVLNLAWNKV